MTTVHTRRLALCLGLVFCAVPFLRGAGDTKPPPEKQNFTGKVVPLAMLVEKVGSRLDSDAAPHWMALVTDDGKVYPLIKDAGARMFFKDKKVLDRPMRLTGRLLPGSQLLQVLEIRSIHKGQLHDIYYWCDICSIQRSEKMICECCGGPMELREEPLRK